MSLPSCQTVGPEPVAGMTQTVGPVPVAGMTQAVGPVPVGGMTQAVEPVPVGGASRGDYAQDVRYIATEQMVKVREGETGNRSRSWSAPPGTPREGGLGQVRRDWFCFAQGFKSIAERRASHSETGISPIETGIKPIEAGINPIKTGINPIETGGNHVVFGTCCRNLT